TSPTPKAWEPATTRSPSVPCFRGGSSQDPVSARNPRKHATRRLLFGAETTMATLTQPVHLRAVLEKTDEYLPNWRLLVLDSSKYQPYRPLKPTSLHMSVGGKGRSLSRRSICLFDSGDCE